MVRPSRGRQHPLRQGGEVIHQAVDEAPVHPFPPSRSRLCHEGALDVLETERFTTMRAELPGTVEESEDWPALLTAAGLEGATSRSFLLDLPAPLPDAARAFVVETYRRRRDSFADLLDPDDRAALDRLLDPADPAGLHHRPDVFVLAAHTVHVARAAS